MSNSRLVKQKRLRYLQVALLLVALFVILVIVGSRLLGTLGLAIFVGVTGFMVFGYIRQNTVYLPRGAQRLDRTTAPELFFIVRDLAEKGEIGFVPPIYYIPSPTPNAATLGIGDNARLLITDGLLRRLNSREMRGVLAHEITHIRQKDLVLFAVVEGIKQMLVTLAQAGWILLILFFPLALFGAAIPFNLVLALMLAPILALLLQLAISRSREFSADIGAVELTDDPQGLASALRKLEQHSGIFSVLFPVPRRRQESSMFRTHPSTEERVERLMSMG